MNKSKTFWSYRRANTYEVDKWLEDQLQLTTYQKNILHDRELVRFSPFYIYVRDKNKSNGLWRFTLIVWPVYWIIGIIVILIKWVITGNRGLGRWWMEKVHFPWAERLGL